MTATDDDILGELHELVARMIGDRSGPELNGDPPQLGWSDFADAGLLGLEAPEALGGGGATFSEVAVVIEEIGQGVARGPYLGSIVLGVPALLVANGGAARDQLVTDVVQGDATVALCLPGADDLDVILPFRIERRAGKTSIVGEAHDVPDLPEAGALVLPAEDGERGSVIVVLSADAPGVQVDRQPAVDVTRSVGRVRVEATVDDGAVWVLDDPAAVDRLRDRAALAVAIDSLGIARGALERTVAYVGDRRQFGRAIGSFQAVKHQCADIAVSLAASRELVESATHLVVAGDPTASTAVSMAASHSCVAAVKAAGTAMQLHGGIGYAWEGGIHLYLKRAIHNRSLFGSPSAHRARLAHTLVERNPPAVRSR